ncbi:MAG: hypothetical protein Q4E36_04965 [Bacillota bacterium]|nr:hypothetical protein [Bacillota bacterium]
MGKFNNSKKVLIPIYLVAALLIGSLGYAWWGGIINGPEDKKVENTTLSVGQGQAVSTVINLSEIADASGKNLVPADRVDQSVGGAAENTESYTFNIPVEWKESSDTNQNENDKDQTSGVTGTIKAEAGAVKVGENGSTELIKVNFGQIPDISLNGDTVKVPVTVTMKEPDTQDAYDVIKGAQISFDVTVSVTKNE